MAGIALETAEFLQLPEHGILHRPAGAGTFGRPGDIVPADGQVGGKGIAADLLSGLRGLGGPEPVHLHHPGTVPERQIIHPPGVEPALALAAGPPGPPQAVHAGAMNMFARRDTG